MERGRGRGMSSEGRQGRRLRAVMLLLVFLAVTEHFIIGGFFSGSPPLSLTTPGPPTVAAVPDLLVFGSEASNKSREMGAGND